MKVTGSMRGLVYISTRPKCIILSDIENDFSGGNFIEKEFHYISIAKSLYKRSRSFSLWLPFGKTTPFHYWCHGIRIGILTRSIKI